MLNGLCEKYSITIVLLLSNCIISIFVLGSHCSQSFIWIRTGMFAVHFKPGSEYRLKDQSSGCSIQMWYKCQVFLMEKHWLRCIKELYLHGLFYVSTSPLFIVILKDEDLCKIMEKLGFLSCCFPYYITLKFFKSLSIYFLADQYFWTNTEYRGNESPWLCNGHPWREIKICIGCHPYQLSCLGHRLYNFKVL